MSLLCGVNKLMPRNKSKRTHARRHAPRQLKSTEESQLPRRATKHTLLAVTTAAALYLSHVWARIDNVCPPGGEPVILVASPKKRPYTKHSAATHPTARIQMFKCSLEISPPTPAPHTSSSLVDVRSRKSGLLRVRLLCPRDA